ncbi:hypothetical protein COB72_10695 [bacterium]|nr:MAG: hypothetical protein COB72_10695 [bacterium]
MKNHEDCGRGGFSLVECLALVLVMSMIGMTAGPTLFSMKQSVHREMSASNLRSIGQGGGLYANANQGRLFSYSWRAGESYVMPNGQTVVEPGDLAAATRQDQEILMRLTGRISGAFKILEMQSRVPHRRYNHVVLADYLGSGLQSGLFIDPADSNLLSWNANPLEFAHAKNTLPYGMGYPEDGYDDEGGWDHRSILQRWGFGSSYSLTVSAWQADFPTPRYYPLARTPHLFAGGSSAGRNLSIGRQLSEVTLPGNKVWMFEEFDREQVGEPYFGYDHARAEKLMFDGSVNSWVSGDSRPAGVPEATGRLFVWLQKYVPLDTFPVPLGGLGDETLVHQRYRWTYQGLHGVDYAPGIPDREPGRR